MAQQRGGIASLVGAIGDNGLTRGWNDLVTSGLIRPVERLLLGPAAEARDTQMRLARHVAADLAAHGGTLSEPAVALLQRHVDPAVDVERLNRATARMDAARLGEEERAVQINTLLAQGAYRPGLVERGDVDPQRTGALREALLAGQPQRATTEVGELLRQYGPGSPLAAYGALGALVAGVVAAAAELNRGGPMAQPAGEMGA